MISNPDSSFYNHLYIERFQLIITNKHAVLEIHKASRKECHLKNVLGEAKSTSIQGNHQDTQCQAYVVSLHHLLCH